MYKCLFEGNIDPFINNIIEFHRKKNILEFRDYNESAFQTTVEFLLPNEGWVSEMRLITKIKSLTGIFGTNLLIFLYVDRVENNRRWV